MRIVGGTLSGRKIEPPQNTHTRPMLDRVREALFNILAHRDWGRGIGDVFTDETHVLDAFCGTGALACEALSWGAGHATLFDTHAPALAVARQNADALDLTSRCKIMAAAATQPPRNAGKPCKLIFLDPPYRQNLIPPGYSALVDAGWIAPIAVIVAATAKIEMVTLAGADLVLTRHYADTGLHFFLRSQK